MRRPAGLDTLPYLLLGPALFIVGLMALNHMVNTIWPLDVARLDLVRAAALGRADAAQLLEATNQEIILAFLAIILMTVTGLILPLAFYLNKRFFPQAKPAFLTVLRQSMWTGLWIAFCVWLQMNRTLGIAVAGLVAAVLILFEILLQIRIRAAHVQQ